MKIFIDMDEVVADFTSRADQILGRSTVLDKYTKEEWKILAQHPRIYHELIVREGGYELVDWLRDYCSKTNNFLAFLTAVPRSMPWAFQDKVYWAQWYFPGIPVFFGPYSRDKWSHCSSSLDILIDDRDSNCLDWCKVGGRAHCYTNWPDCKIWLEQVLCV
jgi:hypothetical protein